MEVELGDCRDRIAILRLIGKKLSRFTVDNILWLIEVYQPVLNVRPLLLCGCLGRMPGIGWVIFVSDYGHEAQGEQYAHITLIHEIMHLQFYACGFGAADSLTDRELNVLETVISKASKGFVTRHPRFSAFLFRNFPRKARHDKTTNRPVMEEAA